MIQILRRITDGKLSDVDSAILGIKTGFGITPLFSRFPTNIVLLHVGTNDIEYTSKTPNEIANNVNTVLTHIDDQSDSTVVILAKVILDDNDNEGVNGTQATRTKQYNNDLITMAVNRVVNNDDRLIMVNMQDSLIYPDSGITPPSAGNQVPGTDIYYDSGLTFLHPYQTGYDKIANIWLNALDGYFTDKPLPITPLNTSTIQTIPDTLAWGITQHAVSYRVQVSTDMGFNQLVYNTSGITNRYKILNNSDVNSGNGFLSSTTYYWRIQPLDVSSGDLGSFSDVWSFTTKPLQVSAKVFLQGPYAGGDTMTTALNYGGYLQTSATSQPYNIAPWNYSGIESVTTIPAGVVDWVLIELRSGTDSASTVARRAAFIKSNGDIVDIDGVSPVNFSGILFVIIMLSSTKDSPCSYVRKFSFSFE